MKFVAVCILSLAFLATGSEWGGGDFDYVSQDQWGEQFEGCAGDKQSPVNLFTGIRGEEVFTGHSTLVVDVSSSASGLFENNGHSLQLTLDRSEGSEPSGTLTSPGAKRLFPKDAGFTLAQVHFHSPSEHTVNGKRYDMEQHFVFVEGDVSGQHRIAVVGTFYTAENDVANNGLAILFGGIPVVGQERTIEAIDLSSLLPAADSAYFSYRGSLTTPPCTEGVFWHVYRDPLDVSEDQLGRFNKFYRGNYRDLQRLNGRFSVLNGPSPFSSPFPELDVTYEYPQ